MLNLCYLQNLFFNMLPSELKIQLIQS
jgi:hypothetical protein